MAEKKIIFLGAPESGKTTFIACLWDYINSEKGDKRLELENLKNTEDEYLEKIKTEWLQCKKVPRTYMVNKTENVTMKVLNVSSKEKFTLEIPDLSGELFDSFYRNRKWDKDFDDLLATVSGIILFVDPTNTNNRSQFLSDAFSMKDVLKGGKEPKRNENDKEAEALDSAVEKQQEKKFVMKHPKQWMHDFSSTQVKLVDLLQFIEERTDSKKSFKVSVVISRWDVVKKSSPNVEPLEWFIANLPLVNQYITANCKVYSCNVFGVSAQGCNYEDEPERQKTLKLDAYNRPIVQLGKDFASDISSPIMWLIENES